ncbi:hypothetical protein TrRE_jg9275 [Triparma retinervis]|uniref:Glutaredoxin 2 C-terminal domain-containing protein n=1 Tax=Triparma retinervis TaxID=2557542 RepID=A0A9W7AL10_9STRA|nr:hypothetical protein TrRE_jg9275 [Triparma retinervis]
MKTILLTLSLLASATAFTSPVQLKASYKAVSLSKLQAAEKNVFEDLVGNSDFRGKRFDFDPLNLAAAYPPFVPFFREAELRHGRTAMLAVIGFIATDFVRLPGDMYSFESIPKTIDIHDALLKTGPMYQLLLWIGLWDILVTAPSIKALGEGFREPGDFGWRWFAPESKEGFDVKRDAELKNGRLAMIAVGGIATQSIITGHGFPYRPPFLPSMKLSLLQMLIFGGHLFAFASSFSSPVTTPVSQPPRIVMDTLPTVHVYDHCPFCVRVRLAFGIKNVKFRLDFLGNDDVERPTSLVGKKIAPIYSFPQDDLIMGESMDIIKLVDSDPRFGPTSAILPATSRTDIKAWQKSVQTLLRTLQRPRYVATGLMPEFQQIDGRHAFIKNHQLPPYEKKEWKEGGMSMDSKLELYASAMASDPSASIASLNAALVELDGMVHCPTHCSDVGGISYDDIDLWSRLRSITIVKGVVWPGKLREYMDNLSAMGDVPLYDEMAL